MSTLDSIINLLFFPCGLFLLFISFIYEWLDRKIIARFQNRIGPRWFQPFADILKLLAKEEIFPKSVNKPLFVILPILAFACVMTSGLYIPLFGFQAPADIPGDLIITMYLLSAMTVCLGMAGANSMNRFAVVGATRTLTQLFAYEGPFMLALLLPALAAQTWNINEIADYASKNIWMIFTYPIGFIVALIGLIGKLELPPFDAPEAESEIVSGALSEYSGRGLALFHIAKNVELVLGLALISAFYLGGASNPLFFTIKTVVMLTFVALLQSTLTRLRIDQTVGLWWQIGALLTLTQLLIVILMRYL